jgi:hypothetical protein
MRFGFAIPGDLKADWRAGVGDKGRECPLMALFCPSQPGFSEIGYDPLAIVWLGQNLTQSRLSHLQAGTDLANVC